MPDGNTGALKAPGIGHNRPTKSAGQKHHYVPVFYQKPWASADGRLCEFSRPYKEVKPRLTHPDGTGYVRGLYTFDALAPDAADFIERQFFLLADGQAALAHQRLLERDVNFGVELKIAWARFMMTLFHRAPEAMQRLFATISERFPGELASLVADLKKKGEDVSLETVRAQITPARFQELSLRVMHRVMDSEMVGTALIRMYWAVIEFHNYRYPLLTSDRPIVMTNGLNKLDAHLVMPISPTKLFVAANDPEVVLKINSLDMKLTEVMNDQVVRQARKYVYGTDDSQLRFVEKRLGERKQWSPLE